jgi:C4-dicarboxylate-specific signal transduction histidine kinase
VNRWWKLGLATFFIGLAALEIAHGVFRLQVLRESRVAELDRELERQHDELARELRSRFELDREHVRYLARAPAVRALLAGPPSADSVAELGRQLLPYLVSFRSIDRVALLGAQGEERFRCERIGGGVGVLPLGLLGTRAEPALLELAAQCAAGEVRASELFFDAARVEVPESDRSVLHLVAPVLGDEARLGTLVLTLYAAPLLQRVRDFQPVAGAFARLVDEHGREVLPASSRATLDAQAAGSVLAGFERARAREAAVLEQPPLRLLAVLPEHALEQALRPLRAEALRIGLAVAAVTVLLALASLAAYRVSLRSVRLHEAERFLAQIRAESAKYRALMDGAADAVLIVDAQRGSVRELNARARELLAAAQGDVLAECFEPESRAALAAALTRAAQAPGASVAEPELRARGAGGAVLLVDARLAAIDIEGARVVELALRDLTREREVERQLRIAERMGSLGMLTAGVAHEINNPLEGIANYLALLERPNLDEEQRARYLERIRHGFARIRDIVRELLSFARPGVGGERAELSEVVRRALELLRFTKDFGALAIELEGLEQPLHVSGDSGRLEQVLLNVLLNAARAMGGRGRIRIRAERGEGCVLLYVEDEGPGIPEQHLAHIFDPFFTTTQGTGLGLAVSYGIARDCGGSLQARNLPGGGAQLCLRLPLIDSASAAAPRAPGTEA